LPRRAHVRHTAYFVRAPIADAQGAAVAAVAGPTNLHLLNYLNISESGIRILQNRPWQLAWLSKSACAKPERFTTVIDHSRVCLLVTAT
jgi:hypothetical protein